MYFNMRAFTLVLLCPS